MTPGGKRQRFFFGTRQEALNYCEAERIRLENHGTAGMTGLSVTQLAQAAAAFETLKPHGVTLSEVVHDWLARKQAAEASVAFEAANGCLFGERQA